MEMLKLLFTRKPISMAEDPDKPDHSDTPGFDPRIQTENIAFDPQELVACVGCGRSNPPTRLKCLYCGRDLETKAENAELIKPTLRKLELWERGINLILAPRQPETEPDV